MRLFSTLLITATLCIGGVSTARADYNVWADARTGLSFSYPDTWQIVNNADPDDVLTVMPPSGRGNAMCRVRAREDGRYNIYPSSFSSAIQKVEIDQAFWETYVGEYTNGQLFEVHDGGSLGRGFAGYAVAGYDSAVPGPMMRRRAVAFASLYRGTLYIAECSSHRDVFGAWHPQFMSVISSIDFRKADHELITGHYRNFLRDKKLDFQYVGDGDSIIKAPARFKF